MSDFLSTKRLVLGIVPDFGDFGGNSPELDLAWTLVWLVGIFLAYAFWGNHLPYPLWHRGYSIHRVIEQMYLTMDGIWSIPVGVSASFIFLFVLFGALLSASGTGSFFSDFADSLAGRTTGGPAKTAVISSALMSMLSGSSTANVVTTGSFTIPAMKRSGYPAHFAGGVEAVASTGGLIAPPVMGAAAFIMAEFLGVPYSKIMQAAAIPAFLYFLALLFMVDLEARRLGLTPSKDVTFPSPFSVLRQRGYLMGPVIILVYALIEGYTPAMSSVWSIASLIILILLFDSKGRKRILKICWDGMTTAPKLIGPIVIACAVGGILAGVITLTGLGFRITTIITAVSGNSLIITLMLTMVIAVILGMGMPTSAIYIILAVILAPALEKMGVEPIAAHMFIFYGAVMSNITPPLAMASFAAAAISESNPWKTSWAAVRIGLTVFIIPFMFVYGPALVGVGTLWEIIQVLGTAIVGVFALSIACSGWFINPLGWWLRGSTLGAAILLIHPDGNTDIVGFAGVGLFVVYNLFVKQNISGLLEKKQANR